jgi:putative ABC transport system permease protein
MNAPLLRLAVQSLLNRRVTALLTMAAIALSVTLLLGVEKVRTGARLSFANTISGTDLIVGARSGSIQLLLYSVFRIGDATNNISWASYQDIRKWPEVAWSVPISLGDSHRGFRVIGTTAEYFQHYKYGRKQALAFEAGKPFADLFDAVVGADVAKELGYSVGDQIVLAHGAGAIGFAKHADKPFTISGILARTGTPVDRSVHVSLQAIEAIHIDWEDGRAPRPGRAISAEEARLSVLQPKAVTAVFIGLKTRMATFSAQRKVNTYKEEALLAVLPGVALQQLWDTLGGLEAALSAISVLVVVTGFMGMIAVSLSALNERRREMAILRSLGAGPRHIFVLLVLEAGFLAAAAAIVGAIALYGGLWIAQPIVLSRYGVYLPIAPPDAWELTLLGLVVAAGCISGVIPALLAYRRSLADGMSVRL